MAFLARARGRGTDNQSICVELEGYPTRPASQREGSLFGIVHQECHREERFNKPAHRLNRPSGYITSHPAHLSERCYMIIR